MNLSIFHELFKAIPRRNGSLRYATGRLLSIYNNRIVNLSRAWLTWTDGRQAASADRLRAGIKGSGSGRQAQIAMSRQRRYEGGRTGGLVQAIPTQSGLTARYLFSQNAYPSLHVDAKILTRDIRISIFKTAVYI